MLICEQPIRNALLLAVLSACTPSPAPPVVSTLSITAPAGRVKIGDSPVLMLSTADQYGNPIGSAPSWSSDQSNVIAVDQSGTLTVRHLDAVPVTVTASQNGVSSRV